MCEVLCVRCVRCCVELVLVLVFVLNCAFLRLCSARCACLRLHVCVVSRAGWLSRMWSGFRALIGCGLCLQDDQTDLVLVNRCVVCGVCCEC